MSITSSHSCELTDRKHPHRYLEHALRQPSTKYFRRIAICSFHRLTGEHQRELQASEPSARDIRSHHPLTGVIMRVPCRDNLGGTFSVLVRGVWRWLQLIALVTRRDGNSFFRVTQNQFIVANSVYDLLTGRPRRLVYHLVNDASIWDRSSGSPYHRALKQLHSRYLQRYAQTRRGS